MLSVNSARQLCKMFLSLHVVFLSVVFVESSASNANQKGNMILSALFYLYLYFYCSFVVNTFKLCCSVSFKLTLNYMHNSSLSFLSPFWLLLHNLFYVLCSHVVLFCYSPDCMRSNGVKYRGEQQSSSSGLTCLNWTNCTRDYDVKIHPDSHTGKHRYIIYTSDVPINEEISECHIKWMILLFSAVHADWRFQMSPMLIGATLSFRSNKQLYHVWWGVITQIAKSARRLQVILAECKKNPNINRRMIFPVLHTHRFVCLRC